MIDWLVRLSMLTKSTGDNVMAAIYRRTVRLQCTAQRITGLLYDVNAEFCCKQGHEIWQGVMMI